jgi:hypothetical protein
VLSSECRAGTSVAFHGGEPCRVARSFRGAQAQAMCSGRYKKRVRSCQWFVGHGR